MFLKLPNRSAFKLLYTSATRCNSEAVTESRRSDYYKNIANNDVDAKPAGWEDAKPFEAVPGPKPIPVLGNMWRFFPYVGNFHGLSVLDLHKTLRNTYGDVVILKGILGRTPMLMLFNPDDMETALRNAGPYPIRKTVESVIYYRTKMREDVFQGVAGLLAVQGEEWFKVRSVINPILMQPRATVQYIGPMDLVANDLIKNMKYYSEVNENNEMPKDFLNELYKWALESIAIVAMNKRLGCLDRNLPEGSDSLKFINSLLAVLGLLHTLEKRIPMWKLLSTPTWRKLVSYMDTITDLSVKYIDECLAEPVDESVPEHERSSVLHQLLKVDRKVAIATVMDMLGAGIDTTGRTLGAVLYYMARYPEKQESLRQEVLKNLPEKDSPVTKQVLDNSPYLKAVIKETTRLAPIGLANLRTSVKDLVLGGYQVPKGIDLLCMHLSSSRSDTYKEPEKFIPERYLRDTDDVYSSKNAHTFASLPFGYGNRSCVGKRFANLELEVALSKIIRNFKLSWHHEDMKFSAQFIHGIASPLKVKVQQLEK